MVKVTLKKQLGKRVAQLRKVKDLSQEKFAELADISITSLSLIETGTNFPKPETLEKFAAVLNVNVQDLFNFQESNLNEMSKDLIKKIKLIKRDKTRLTALYNFAEKLI